MNKDQTQSCKNSSENCTSASQHLSSSFLPLSTLSCSPSSTHSSPSPTLYEQQESNTYNVVTEEFDLISFDDELPISNPLSSLNIKNKTCHLLDDNSIGFSQVKHILDDDSQMKIKQHILDNDNELKNQRHILDDDYDSKNSKDDYEDENFKNVELRNQEKTGIEEEFVEEKNWKDVLLFTIPSSLEYVREFCRIVG
jgi:hypothetical protein